MKGAFLPRLSVLLPAARRCGLMATGLTGLKTFFFSFFSSTLPFHFSARKTAIKFLPPSSPSSRGWV